jgi:TorA maturation chaperone TorD
MAMARAREYLLLAALLTKPPRQALLDEIARISGDASPLGVAHIGLAEAAATITEAAAGREYFNLFIGVGRGEVLPYASYYLTGFLNERPLARVREDMRRLGVERRKGVFEPEDHIGTLCEVMAGLVTGEFGGGGDADEAAAFFVRHLKPWAERLFADIAIAESARFYKSVAEVGRVWMEIENEALQFE